MNEEELKELKELKRDIMKQKLEKIKLAKEENFKDGFQKGKLEQKKEELEFLKYFERCSKNIGSIQTIINRWSYNVEQRIKQLQKEIRGKEK
jgi:gas vesicle protein